MTTSLRRTAPSPRTVLAVASLGGFMAFVDATIVNVAFPDVQTSFPDAPIGDLSWILNAYNIVFAALLVAAGKLADVLGRRRIYLGGLVVFTLASALCAAAPSLGALVGLRVLQAVGAALLVPSSLALVLQAHPAGLRARAVATVAAVSALAAGLGPALGGVLVDAGGWRLVFLANVPFGVLGYALARAKLVEGRQEGRRRMPDLLGALLLAGATAALVLAIVKGTDWGRVSLPTGGTFAGALVLLALFGWRCRVHRSPLVDLALLRHRPFVVANAASIVAAAGFFGYTLVNVLFLTEVWRYSVLGAGLAITPGPVVAIAVSRPFGRLAEKVGHRLVLLGGGLWWGAAVLWFAERVELRPDYPGQWLPGTVMLGIGAGALFPGLSAVAVASALGDGFASSTGLNTVARQVGAALGVAAVVAIVQSADPTSPADVLRTFDHAWVFASACLGAAALGCVFIGRRPVAATDAATPVSDQSALRPAMAGQFPGPVMPGPVAASAGGTAGRRSAHVTVDLRPVTSLRASGSAPRPPGRPRPVGSPVDEAATVHLARRSEEPTAHLARTSLDDATVNLARRTPTDIGAAIGLMGRTPLFAALDERAQRAVAQRSATVRLASGEWLYRGGDAAEAVYVVRSGQVEVLDEASGRVKAALGRGELVGAVAVLGDGTRARSARATRTTELLAIPASAFEHLLLGRPEMSLALNRILADRISADGPPKSRPTPSTIALVPLDPGVPVVALAHHLAAELRRFGRADMLLPVTDTGFGPMLDRALAGNDQVVLPAVPGTPWAEFCLAQADRVLAAGSRVAGQPRPHPAELRGADLVTWDVAPGSGALAGWAEELQPVETHAVRVASVGVDVARLARRLAGRSVGLVLSGGGARAFAHLGVLEELHAAGVVIDRVGGTSMGAFIGALYAMGLDPAEIDARCYDGWVRGRPLRDAAIPRHGLIRGDRARSMLQRTFGDVAIEELPRGLYTAATDLREGELVVTRSGKVVDAVGPSLAVPGLAPPVVRGGRILVDGWLADNLPVATMAALGEGPIIAVDCMADAMPERPPTLAETLSRVVMLAGARNAPQHADLTITPRDPGIGRLEFSQIDAAKEAGREAARRALGAAPSAAVA